MGVFNRTGAPPTINVQGDVNVFNVDGNNNTIHVNSDIIGLARKSHKDLNALASSVQPGRVDTLELSADGDSEKLYFDQSNRDGFKVEKVARQDQQPLDFGVNIFSFNKKSKNGRLETTVNDSEDPVSFAFNIVGDDEMVERCIEALKVGYSHVSALREYEVNALGEKKIKTFHVYDVSPGQLSEDAT